MDFTIKNVGVVKESTIKLDGLTVITGANNSGKSTIGKALYATIEGLNDIEQKHEFEICFNFQRIQRNIIRALHIEAIYSYFDLEKISDADRRCFNMLLFPYFGNREKVGIEDIAFFKDFIERLDEQYIKDILRPTQTKATQKVRTYLANFNDAKKQALKYFDRLNDWLANDNLEKYMLANLVAQFNKEFHDQIAPVRKSDVISTINLSKNGEIGSSFSIRNDTVLSVGRAFNSTFFNDVILIDNPFIVDMLSDNATMNGVIILREPTVPVRSHNDKLLSIFNERETESVIEQKINETQYAEIMVHINKVLPGKVIKQDGRFVYNENNKNDLFVENLATGSKTFAIIKTLLQKGKIGMDTMLILDEPEIHLHPDWQNKFAEVIVLLVKYLDVKVLLTTHSPNFLLAVETMARQYLDKTAFAAYVSEKQENNYTVTMKEITDNIEYAYSHLAKPYLEMDAYRYKLENKDD